MQASLQITEEEFLRRAASQPGKSLLALLVTRRINTILETSATTREELLARFIPQYGVGVNILQRVNFILRSGDASLIKGLEEGTVSVYGAYMALTKSKVPKAKVKRNDQWQRAEDERLAIIEAPSIYPADAPWPFNDHPSAIHLRNAIARLHELEPSIAFMKKREADAFQLLVNAIPAYVANYHNYPRPDGPLDQRWVKWSSSLWVKLQNQFRRIAAKPRAQRPSPAKPASASFERRFEDFWLVIEPQLSAFRKSEKACFKSAMRKAIDQHFSSETEPSDETAPAESQMVDA